MCKVARESEAGPEAVEGGQAGEGGGERARRRRACSARREPRGVGVERVGESAGRRPPPQQTLGGGTAAAAAASAMGESPARGAAVTARPGRPGGAATPVMGGGSPTAAVPPPLVRICGGRGCAANMWGGEGRGMREARTFVFNFLILAAREGFAAGSGAFWSWETDFFSFLFLTPKASPQICAGRGGRRLQWGWGDVGQGFRGLL